jgi:hypothetical protein
MVIRILRYALLLLFLFCTPALAGDGGVAMQAQQGFKEILEIWRAENYEGLYSRLEHPPGKDWPYFVERIVYASRIPACCWEMLQEVKVTVIDADNVQIRARVGLEVEGVGTRFVVRDFPLHRSNGVWKLPMHVVLELADYNLQRIPRKVYERPLN